MNNEFNFMNNETNTLNKSKISTKKIVLTGVMAAIYMVATLMIAPLAYGDVQFRISELLVLLVFIDSAYAPGLILGCALANVFSPLGPIDVVVGTLGTICTTYCISKTKSLFAATLWPTIFCIFVGIELNIVSGLPLLLTTGSVMFGEFCVVTIIGYPVFKVILKNDKLVHFLKINKQ